MGSDPRAALIDGKARRQSIDLLAHRLLEPAIAVRPMLGEALERLREEVPDRLELLDAEAAGGRRRRAEAYAGGDGRLLRIVGNAVLVRGDVGAFQRLLGDVAGDALGAEIDQHQMIVGTAG